MGEKTTESVISKRNPVDSNHIPVVNIYIYIYGVFLKWGYPNSWMVFVREHFIKTG